MKAPVPDRQTVLLVDDSAVVATVVDGALRNAGFETVIAETGEDARRRMADGAAAVAVLGLGLPDVDGPMLLRQWTQEHPETPVIVLAADREIATAVKCVRDGAFDFLVRPLDTMLLSKAVRAAIHHRELRHRVKVLTQLSRRNGSRTADRVVAMSAAMRETLEMAKRVASDGFSCLLVRGECGTGKDLLARTIHALSRFRSGPFVDVNCAAVPESLLDGELFGHCQETPADAVENQAGALEMANGGTLFLNDVAEIGSSLQEKLLRAIEDRRFRRPGGERESAVNVAVIAATSRDLESLVSQGKFRIDLYYRLNVVPLVMPPLRQRKKDIPALIASFVDHFCTISGQAKPAFSPAAMQALQKHAWPGNVRELRNAIERICLLYAGDTVSPDNLVLGPAPAVREARGKKAPLAFPAVSLEEAEKRAIRAALGEANGNKNSAAKILKIHRSTLYSKLREYRITAIG